MSAYYNEIDPGAAAWLRELIAQGHIAPGDVDERSIEDVTPADLLGYTQCHFFAGIGVWSYALRAAGWPDDRPVWTGSCPCPPFSTAGRGQTCPECGGRNNLCHPRRTGYFICLACGNSRYADGRHLWPEFSRLIRECRPDATFGEQVAGKDGLAWLDTVSADLEGSDFSVGALDTCAAGFGAPHIRQRLYWAAEDLRPADGLANTDCNRRQSRVEIRPICAQSNAQYGQRPDGSVTRLDRPGPTNGFWRDADWLYSRDGKWRPAQPGTCPLAHGSAARVGRLRGYGNAIVAPQATAFIQAYLDVRSAA